MLIFGVGGLEAGRDIYRWRGFSESFFLNRGLDLLVVEIMIATYIY